MTPLLAALAAAGIGLVPAGSPGVGSPSVGPARLALLPFPGPAQPPRIPASVASEVMVLHASHDHTGIDPRIGPVPALTKAPFSSYDSYRLLTRTSAPLEQGKQEGFPLPTGNELRVLYKDAILPRSQGQVVRFLIAASIHKPSGAAVLPLVEYSTSAGEWFWVGGQPYKGGAMFIGIKLD